MDQEIQDGPTLDSESIKRQLCLELTGATDGSSTELDTDGQERRGQHTSDVAQLLSEMPATINSSSVSDAWVSVCALLVLSVFLFDFKTSLGASLVTFGGLFIWEVLVSISQRILVSLATVLILMFGIAGLDIVDQWNLAIYLGMASVTMYVALLTVEE